MRKLILFIAKSIDGYIARPDGDVNWLEDKDFMVEGEDFGYQAFFESIDTTLMGGGTYKAVLGFGIPWPYPEQTNYVFTRSDYPANDHVTFIKDDIATFVGDLKKQRGKDIWLVGGGKINSIMIETGLIDEMIITIMPITLGEGISLFSKVSHEQKFKLKSHKVFESGVVQLIYNL